MKSFVYTQLSLKHIFLFDVRMDVCVHLLCSLLFILSAFLFFKFFSYSEIHFIVPVDVVVIVSCASDIVAVVFLFFFVVFFLSI